MHFAHLYIHTCFNDDQINFLFGINLISSCSLNIENIITFGFSPSYFIMIQDHLGRIFRISSLCHPAPIPIDKTCYWKMTTFTGVGLRNMAPISVIKLTPILPDGIFPENIWANFRHKLKYCCHELFRWFYVSHLYRYCCDADLMPLCVGKSMQYSNSIFSLKNLPKRMKYGVCFVSSKSEQNFSFLPFVSCSISWCCIRPQYIDSLY